MGVRGVVALAPPAAKPEGVEEEEEEVQGQTQQCHGAEQQNGLLRHKTTAFQRAFGSAFYTDSAGM